MYQERFDGKMHSSVSLKENRPLSTSGTMARTRLATAASHCRPNNASSQQQQQAAAALAAAEAEVLKLRGELEQGRSLGESADALKETLATADRVAKQLEISLTKTTEALHNSALEQSEGNRKYFQNLFEEERGRCAKLEEDLQRARAAWEAAAQGRDSSTAEVFLLQQRAERAEHEAKEAAATATIKEMELAAAAVAHREEVGSLAGTIEELKRCLAAKEGEMEEARQATADTAAAAERVALELKGRIAALNHELNSAKEETHKLRADADRAKEMEEALHLSKEETANTWNMVQQQEEEITKLRLALEEQQLNVGVKRGRKMTLEEIRAQRKAMLLQQQQQHQQAPTESS